MAMAWDVMGGHRLDGVAEDCRFDSPNVALRHTRSGPGINAPNLFYLGWLDRSRVAEYSHARAEIRVTLAPLNHPEVAGSMMARVPLLSPDFAHVTVQLRWNDQWDRGIPRPAFIVHVQDREGYPYLVRASPKEHDWIARSTYNTPDGMLLIDFIEINPGTKKGLIGIRPAAILGLKPILVDGKRRWRRPGPIPQLLNLVAWRVRYVTQSMIVWLKLARAGSARGARR